MRRHASVLHWYTYKVVFRQLPTMFADSFSGVLSIHCFAQGLGASFLHKCPASRDGSLRQHSIRDENWGGGCAPFLGRSWVPI